VNIVFTDVTRPSISFGGATSPHGVANHDDDRIRRPTRAPRARIIESTSQCDRPNGRWPSIAATEANK